MSYLAQIFKRGEIKFPVIFKTKEACSSENPSYPVA